LRRNVLARPLYVGQTREDGSKPVRGVCRT
jgi:hypothetical protein